MNSIDVRKASDSIAEATVSLLDAADMLFMDNPKGAANFRISAFKALGRSYGYALRAFQAYLSKIDSRSVHEINRS